MAEPPFRSPDGTVVDVFTTANVLFSDDFGGTALDATRWTTLDGGQGAVTLGNGSAQAAIGTGSTIGAGAVTVSGSNLAIAMPATSGAEFWLLSNAKFAGVPDFLVIASKSVVNANNSGFIGFVEVDPQTGFPLLNPNFALDFTNRGGLQIGANATGTVFNVECVGDSSSAQSSSNTNSQGGAPQTLNANPTEFAVEVRGTDVVASANIPDTNFGRTGGMARVSTQLPNPTKVYRLIMRFKNTGATACTWTIGRILVRNSQEVQARISGGTGDNAGAKGVPVNETGSALLTRVKSAATTNDTLVKAFPTRFYGGTATNTTASAKFVRIFNKATTPVDADIPVITVTVPANSTVSIPPSMGKAMLLTAGFGYNITGAVVDGDATATAVGDVLATFFFQ